MPSTSAPPTVAELEDELMAEAGFDPLNPATQYDAMGFDHIDSPDDDDDNVEVRRGALFGDANAFAAGATTAAGADATTTAAAAATDTATTATDTIHYQLPNVHERSTAATPRTVDGPTFYGRFRPRHVIFDRVVIRICSPAVDQVRVEAGGSLLQTSLALNFHGLHSWRLGGWSGGRARTILAQRLCRLPAQRGWPRLPSSARAGKLLLSASSKLLQPLLQSRPRPRVLTHTRLSHIRYPQLRELPY